MAGRGNRPSYQIVDGVRRAKAAHLLGKRLIAAHIFDDAERLVWVGKVRISDLRSPKNTIEVFKVADWMRWNDIVEATERGEPLPPIDIRPGNGIPIRNVEFSSDDVE